MKDECKKLIVSLAAIVTVFVMPSANAELVMYWTLDQMSGNLAIDSTDNGISGLLKGHPVWIAGRIGRGLEFDGVDDFVDVDVRIVEGSLSIALWLRYDTVPEHGSASIMCNDTWQRGSVHVNLRYTRTFCFHVLGPSGTKSITSNLTLVPGRWYHIVAVYNTSTRSARIYIDGLLDAEELSFSAGKPWIGPMNVGAWRHSKNHLDGSIDDVCIFDHALNSDEVKKLYVYGGRWFVHPASPELVWEVQRAKAITEREASKEAIALLEKTIKEFGSLKKMNTNEIGLQHRQLLSELHFLLAKAREAAGAPTQSIIAAYEQSVLQSEYVPHYVPTLLWLFKNASASDYTDAIKKTVGDSYNALDYLPHIVKDFESSNDWSAFKVFLDIVFSEVGDSTLFGKSIADGLKEGGLWAGNFSKYARENPKLRRYVIGEYEERAEKSVAQRRYRKAAEIYLDIMNQWATDQDRPIYQLKIFECFLGNGEYDRALSELDDFINNRESINRDFVARALVLKGRTYIQLGEIEHARDAFLKVLREYPETESAPGATFFIGYSSMLKSDFNQATKAFSALLKDFPGSRYADRARSYLIRIRNMTE
jgi:tetratricopeptide (TPR) repeat protein